jgi:AhpD family alkylhydroperoxidase
MAHIELEQNIPGIRSLALFRPDTGKPLYQLAQILLGEDSSRNNCDFCMSSHAAAARYLYKTDAGIVDLALNDYKNAPISDKLRTLLSIALHVQQDARTVNNEQVALAKSFGATDRDIHDTVLIAAVFCMINRYVDGLATLTPTDPAIYAQMGERMGTLGYVIPTIKQ